MKRKWAGSDATNIDFSVRRNWRDSAFLAITACPCPGGSRGHFTRQLTWYVLLAYLERTAAGECTTAGEVEGGCRGGLLWRVDDILKYEPRHLLVSVAWY